MRVTRQLLFFILLVAGDLSAQQKTTNQSNSADDNTGNDVPEAHHDGVQKNNPTTEIPLSGTQKDAYLKYKKKQKDRLKQLEDSILNSNR